MYNIEFIIKKIKNIFINLLVFKHTYGTSEGSFMYFDSIGSGRLLSPVQNPTAGSCVHFYYLNTGLSEHLSNKLQN